MSVEWCWLMWCVAALVLLYIFLEFHYFLRMCICVLMARFIKRNCHILETTSVFGLCLTNDIDTLLCHMNNARYLREIDFARADFYERTKLYRTILAKEGVVYQGATTIRYRKLIRPLRRFRITSRIIYWDDESVYMEHRFIRPSDQFIHCIAICRQRILNCSVIEIMNDLLTIGNEQQQRRQEQQEIVSSTVNLECKSLDQLSTENGRKLDNIYKPHLPPEVGKWIEYNDLSSKILRQTS